VRDFGVCRVFGAMISDVFCFVIGNAVRVVAMGVVIGLVLLVVGGRFIQMMLFGVRLLDLVTFAFVTIVLGIIAVLSIVGPVWCAV